MYPDLQQTLKTSTGFQWRFSKRHSLKSLAIQGEQASADIVCDSTYLNPLIEGYSMKQIFNCDETELQFCLLPQKTLASSFENGKKGKERVTINACDNVSGSIKLPLLFIGKNKR